ncbi:MAG: ABC transporter permease [Desulfovibrionales bacterium]|nr:ABC transporter permease [Desulfovibrionales bacterium]
MRELCAVKRQEPLGWGSCLIFLAALTLAFSFSGMLLAMGGKPALGGLWLLVHSAFGSGFALEDCLVKAVPIFLCATGVGLTFRLQIWNIGAEGQFALGAVGATWMALTFPAWPWYALLPAMLACASLAGALWGAIPALLRLKLGANEIIVTLMLNYVGILVLEYLVYGVWKDPGSFGFPMTSEFVPAAVVGRIGDTRLNWGLALCLVAGGCMSVFLRFTRLGYELRACGENVRAARSARMPYAGLVVTVMVVSGALSGWAGFLESSAILGRLQPSIMSGYGYTAIVVAWLANLRPLVIAVASFLLAGLRVGMETLQLDLQVPASFGSIMEGFVLLAILSGGFFSRYRLQWRTRG